MARKKKYVTPPKFIPYIGQDIRTTTVGKNDLISRALWVWDAELEKHVEVGITFLISKLGEAKAAIAYFNSLPEVKFAT